MKFSFSRFLPFVVVATLIIPQASAQVVEIPDPNLEKAVREALNLPDNTPITKQEMLRLTRLRVESPDLRELTGLEHATNLADLSLGTVGRVSDLTPLSNLISLRNLNVARNQISDIRPLAGLINLKGLILWDNQVRDIALLANLTNLTDLDLSGNNIDTLDPLADLVRLRILHLSDNGIADITFLAHLTNLTKLMLSHNQISDLNPLAGLTRLTYLNLRNNRISNLNPLSGLTGLTYLSLRNNHISNLNPLIRLTGVTDLNLRYNRISDFSPLANLVNLKELWIDNNFGTDISPLQGLNLTEFHYDAICDVAPHAPSVTERMENRRFPSIFRVKVLGSDRTEDEWIELHDLSLDTLIARPWVGLDWLLTETKPTFGLSTQVGGNLEQTQETQRRRQQLNPNLVSLIATISWSSTGNPNRFPPDSEFWLRDENGEIVQLDYRGQWIEYQTDFFHPGYQDLLVERIVAVANCGIVDGIVLDGFFSNATGFFGRYLRPQSNEEIIGAMTNILSRVRARVRDDFLILVNANRTKLTAYKEYVNGSFMETLQDHPKGYTHDGLREIENTLLWSEQNLRAPQINCLEGWGIGNEAPDSPANQQWMRVFTTMSLTHSDGYVMYNTGAGNYGGSDHSHIWYDFWDADLGYPVDPKAQPYQNVDGLFIREFTNGWAVYNRSQKTQEISLPESVTGVSSGKSGTTHLLPDLDGEIYLKAPNPADVNGDGKINILDLLQVANSLGEAAPDPNGDGVVNTLDLVFVAQQFSQ